MGALPPDTTTKVVRSSIFPFGKTATLAGLPPFFWNPICRTIYMVLREAKNKTFSIFRESLMFLPCQSKDLLWRMRGKGNLSLVGFGTKS